jgi:hypothetical protein
MSDPAKPRAAPPEPRSLLVSTLADELRKRCPRTFAGLGYAPDGTLEVFSTGDETLDAVVSRFTSEAPGFHMRVVNGRLNSVSDLEAIRDKILERMRAGRMPAIQILELGLDVRSNCVRVGVASLTPETIAALELEYGAHRLCVVQGGMYTTS